MNFLLRGLVYFWEQQDKKVPLKIDVIMPLSYGTNPHGLAESTKEGLMLAIREWHKRTTALIAIDYAEWVFRGAGKIEKSFKEEILKREGVPMKSILDVGTTVNTVTEAFALREATEAEGIKPGRILLVTTKMHSRGAKLIYKLVFPAAEIFVATIGYEFEIQRDHPVLIQRNAWAWFLANVVRQILLRAFGLKIAKLHQVAAKVDPQ